jgi:MFS family permease
MAPMEMAPSDRIANIGAGGRRKRFMFGIVALGAGVLIAVLLVAVDAPRIWRIPLFLVFYAAALGIFQAREKT